jgi:hypothetical protein
MRVEAKNTLVGGAMLAGTFAFFVAAIEIRLAFLVPALAWFAAFSVIRKRVVKCPACGIDATRTKHGMYVPWTGTTCRFCGSEY